MYIILGGTGHIGSALSQYLLDAGHQVLVITHDSKKVAAIEQTGAKAAVVDIMDSAALNRIFRQGKHLFLLNPPADPATDTDDVERQSLTAIFKALEDSGLEKIVAESTYGAQPGDDIADLGVLYEMEEALQMQQIPYSVMRGAYYFSNWDMALETAQKEGKVYSFYPPGFTLPMVAPADIAKLAFKLLTSDGTATGPQYITGPQDYAPDDVAVAFAKALGKPVEVVEIPQDQWVAQFKAMGYSDKAAQSMANMTRLTLQQGGEQPDKPNRGTTTLDAYVAGLVAGKA